MRKVLFAGKEPQKWSALLRDVVTDRSGQHRISRLESVEDRALRRLALHFEFYLPADLGQCSQVGRKRDANHDRVWTSTESTGGRSRAMGCQLSPASDDAYTCPPVVPK